jgi:deoxyribodipyrimidine photo-lyase
VFQAQALDHLTTSPAPAPLEDRRREPIPLPADVVKRWPLADPALLDDRDASLLGRLPLDHAVPPVALQGGPEAAGETLRRFLEERLDRYDEDRNQPGVEGTSGLSPYLHFGHVSIHDVAAEVLRRDGWDPGRVAPGATGARAGWWGASPPVESFLDEAIIWRELGYHFAWHRLEDHARYESLPPWAIETLEDHAGDPRPHLYDRAGFETAATHDPLWNAAQNQLRAEGRIHGYLRMLWGKKILEWSPHPREALATMLALNDRWAIDGRDPNSVSGIFWVLGRFDRPWGPERPIFGKVRYMTSRNTARKFDVKGYLERWTSAPVAADG